MMRKLVLALGITSVIFLLHPRVFSEYVSESVKGGDTKRVEYKNVVDYEYQIWVGAMNRWKFDGSFDINAGYIGWYKGTDSESVKVAKTVSSMLLFAPTVFPVTMSGRIIPTDEGEGPPPPTDWTVQVAEGEGEATIDPATAIIAIGDSQTYTYKLNGAAFNAYWFYPDGWSSSMSSTFNFPPVSAYSPEHFTIQARLNTLNQGAASAEAWYVGIESISGGGITSTTSDPGPEQTIIVLKGSPAITFVVQKAPENAPTWPDNYPIWSPGDAKGNSYTFNQTNTAGEYIITSTCGLDQKSIKVVVLEIVSLVREKSWISFQSSETQYKLSDQYIDNTFTVKTNPEGYEYLVDLELDPVYGSNYGSVVRDSDNPQKWYYSSPTEYKSDISLFGSYDNEGYTYITCTVSTSLMDIKQAKKVTFRLFSVFGCLGILSIDREKAWRYARWKYDISTANLGTISYDSQLGNYGNTHTSLTNEKTMTLGSSAFENEWLCASVLGHENVHGTQSLSQIIALGDLCEIPAYQWEMDHSHAIEYGGAVTFIYDLSRLYYNDGKNNYIRYGGINQYP